MSGSELDGAVTERVGLQPVPLDLARIIANPQASEPRSPSWADDYPLPGTRIAARNVVEQAEAAGAVTRGQWGMFQMILRETSEVIGDIGFHGPPDDSGTVEIGYGVVERYRGRGLVGESAVALCDLAWSYPEVNRIIARTNGDNAASAGVLRHAGFREDSVTDGVHHFSLVRP